MDILTNDPKPMPDLPIRLDLASETGRRFAVLPPDFAQKMARRLQRKFKVKIAVDVIIKLVNSNASIYHFTASVLKECILPHIDEYASASHVDDNKLMGKVRAQFPIEDVRILNEIVGWVIYYEYLR